MRKVFLFLVLSVLWLNLRSQAQMIFPYEIYRAGSLGMCLYGEADINQDSYRDLIARTFDEVLVYSGRDFPVLYSFPGYGGQVNSLTAVDANDDGFPDIVATKSHTISVYSGKDGSALYDSSLPNITNSVDKISDMDNDDVDDILVAGESTSLILSGKDGGQIRDLGVPSQFGVILALDDIDGDSVADIGVSSDRLGFGDQGVAILISGATGSILRTILGGGGGFGFTMTSCPDQDGDGTKDLIIARTSKDTVYVYSTKTGQLIAGIGMPFGEAGGLGTFIDNLADLNGDGYDDIAISDPFNRPDPGSYAAGAVFLLSGRDFKLINSFYGVEVSYFGFSATALGDLNADGRKEIAIGAPGDSRVYIFSVCTPGDANQDGKLTLVDVVIKINHVFKSRALPLPASASDDNCNGSIDLDDIICTVNYIFKNQTQGCCFK